VGRKDQQILNGLRHFFASLTLKGTKLCISNVLSNPDYETTLRVGKKRKRSHHCCT